MDGYDLSAAPVTTSSERGDDTPDPPADLRKHKPREDVGRG